MIKRLGDICTFVGGGTPSKKNPDFYKGSIPWATVRDMNVRVIKTTEHSITPDAVQQSATNIIPKGEVVISTHVGLGKVCFLGQDTAINQDLKAVIPNGELSRRYLYYWFISKADELIANGKGATVKGVTLDFVKNLKIQVLPGREQEVVSDTLDKVNHIIELTDSQVTRLDQLVKSRFVEMFGGFGNPKHLPICRVGEVIDAIDPHPSHRTPPTVKEGVPYVGVAECDRKTGTIKFDCARIVAQEVLDEHKSRYAIEQGDFLIGKIGTIGKPFFLPSNQTYVLSANTVLVKPRRSLVEPQFLKIQFENQFIEHQIASNAKSTSQPAFGMNKVRDLRMLNPPLALQREFAAFVAKQLYRAKIQEFFG